MAKRNPGKGRPATEIFTERLPCELTDTEIVELSRTMTLVMERRERLANQLREEGAEIRQRIKSLDSEVREHANEIRNRRTMREVRCERRFNVQRSMVETVRMDTGETYHERPFTDEERQGWLFELPEAAEASS